MLSLVLVWPLCSSGGDGGSRVPLAFGWEVPVSLLRSASGSGEESGRGTERGTSFEEGEWLRYDLIPAKLFMYG